MNSIFELVDFEQQKVMGFLRNHTKIAFLFIAPFISIFFERTTSANSINSAKFRGQLGYLNLFSSEKFSPFIVPIRCK